jgi:hypothetical protein
VSLTSAQHLQAAVARLASVYRDKPVILAFLEAAAAEAAAIDAALGQVYDDALETSVGAQLDGWGRILEEARGALDDDTYRGRLRLKIVRIYSEGTADALLQIFDLLTNAASVELHEHFPAAVGMLAVEPDSVYSEALILEALKQAKAGGVRLDAAHTNGLPAFATLEYAGPHAVAGLVTDATPTGGGTLATDY